MKLYIAIYVKDIGKSYDGPHASAHACLTDHDAMTWLSRQGFHYIRDLGWKRDDTTDDSSFRVDIIEQDL